MNKILTFIGDLLGLVIMGLWHGFCAFILVAIVLTLMACAGLTIVLILNLVAQEPIPWYEIVAPILLFFAIGIFTALDEI